MKEQSYLSVLRQSIEKQYKKHPTRCGGDGCGGFGELLCWEIHSNNMHFKKLAKHWGISLPTLGELIKDHCDRLQELPKANFKNNK